MKEKNKSQELLINKTFELCNVKFKKQTKQIFFFICLAVSRSSFLTTPPIALSVKPEIRHFVVGTFSCQTLATPVQVALANSRTV